MGDRIRRIDVDQPVKVAARRGVVAGLERGQAAAVQRQRRVRCEGDEPIRRGPGRRPVSFAEVERNRISAVHGGASERGTRVRIPARVMQQEPGFGKLVTLICFPALSGSRKTWLIRSSIPAKSD